MTVDAIEPGPGDFNNDNQVDGSDATLLAAHWQEGVPSPTAVPEPAGIVLLMTLLLTPGLLRRFF